MLSPVRGCEAKCRRRAARQQRRHAKSRSEAASRISPSSLDLAVFILDCDLFGANKSAVGGIAEPYGPQVGWAVRQPKRWGHRARNELNGPHGAEVDEVRTAAEFCCLATNRRLLSSAEISEIASDLPIILETGGRRAARGEASVKLAKDLCFVPPGREIEATKQ